MKISVTVYSLRSYFISNKINIPMFIDLVADLGADGVDLGYYWRNEEEKSITLKKLEDRRIELACYITNNDFSLLNEDKRKLELEKVKQAIIDAKNMGAKILRIFAGNLREGINPLDAEKRSIEMLNYATEFAEREGIVLALENHGNYFNKIDVVERILRAINSKYLRLTFDSGNFAKAGDNPLEAIRRLKTYVVHVHAKDIDVNGNLCAPGEGVIDFYTIAKELDSIGYKGFFSVEYEGNKDQIYGVGIGIGYLRALRTKLFYNI